MFISKKNVKIISIFLFLNILSNAIALPPVNSVPRKKSPLIALMKVWMGLVVLVGSGFSGVQGAAVTIECNSFVRRALNKKHSSREDSLFGCVGPVLTVASLPLAYVSYRFIKSGLNDLDEIAQYKPVVIFHPATYS